MRSSASDIQCPEIVPPSEKRQLQWNNHPFDVRHDAALRRMSGSDIFRSCRQRPADEHGGLPPCWYRLPFAQFAKGFLPSHSHERFVLTFSHILTEWHPHCQTFRSFKPSPSTSQLPPPSFTVVPTRPFLMGPCCEMLLLQRSKYRRSYRNPPSVGRESHSLQRIATVTLVRRSCMLNVPY